MRPTQRYRELMTATREAIRFLNGYVEGGRGYTTQDVETGVQRLEGLRRQIEEAEGDGWQVDSVLSVLEAAEDCLEEVRQKLAGVDRG